MVGLYETNRDRLKRSCSIRSTGATAGSSLRFRRQESSRQCPSFHPSRDGLWRKAISRGSEEKSLFHTSNNGGLWDEIMQNTEYPTSRIPGSVIPRTGSVIGLTFTDSLVGFATIREMQSSKLYITRDGGQKWKSSGQVFKSKLLDACGSVLPGLPSIWAKAEAEARFIYRLPA